MPDEPLTAEEYREKLRSIGFLAGGRSGPKVREYRDPEDGHRIKTTTDEHGNDVTQHNLGPHQEERQDVLIRPKPVNVRMVQNPPGSAE